MSATDPAPAGLKKCSEMACAVPGCGAPIPATDPAPPGLKKSSEAACTVPGCGASIPATDPAPPGLKKCKRCGEVAYCSKQCQVAAWKKGHKAACQPRDAEANNLVDSLRFPGGLIRRTLSAHSKRVCKRLHALFNDGQYDDVVELADEALAVADQEHDLWPVMAARMYSMLGFSFLCVNDYTKSYRALAKARPLALQANDHNGLIQVVNGLGSYYTQLGQYEEALVEFQQARALGVEDGDISIQASFANNVGICFQELKRFAEARKEYEHCWRLCMQEGSPEGQARACVRLGSIFLQQGAVLRGVLCLRKASMVFQELKLLGDLADASVLLGRGIIHGRDKLPWPVADQQHRAAVFLNAALRVSKANDLHPTHMASRMYLALLALWCGDADEAVQQVESYLDLCVGEVGPKYCIGCLQKRGVDAPMMVCGGCRVARFCNELHQSMTWKGSPEHFSYGIRHKDVCPLLKQWRLITKGRAEKTAALREMMLRVLQRTLDASVHGRDEDVKVEVTVEFHRYLLGDVEDSVGGVS